VIRQFSNTRVTVMESKNKCLLECFSLLEADFPPCVDVAKLHVVAVYCMERFNIPSSIRM
jgi:hypothetical protein